ncbi:hypothetical protein [Methylobacter sp. Wu1]|uniref:hypothetical protein n=1 Tax=Methylobacter sp. Wu1 TaxID=3119359 RepID=UPI002F93DA1B
MNIKELLNKLNQIGMTDKAIGAEIGVDRNTVCRLRHGRHKSTSFERGLKIYELAKQKLPEHVLNA